MTSQDRRRQVLDAIFLSKDSGNIRYDEESMLYVKEDGTNIGDEEPRSICTISGNKIETGHVVVAKCTHSFDRTTLMTWTVDHDCCPKCEVPIWDAETFDILLEETTVPDERRCGPFRTSLVPRNKRCRTAGLLVLMFIISLSLLVFYRVVPAPAGQSDSNDSPVSFDDTEEVNPSPPNTSMIKEPSLDHEDCASGKVYPFLFTNARCVVDQPTICFFEFEDLSIEECQCACSPSLEINSSKIFDYHGETGTCRCNVPPSP